MGQTELIQFGILLNVTAGLGAFGFAWLDDKGGARKTVMVALVGLTIAAAAAVVAPTVGWFWIAGALLGIFVGPAQAASRSFMARVAPADARTEFFGLYALSGRATAFIGPVLAGIATEWAGDLSAGLATVVLLFLIGLALLTTVREPPPDEVPPPEAAPLKAA